MWRPVQKVIDFFRWILEKITGRGRRKAPLPLWRFAVQPGQEDDEYKDDVEVSFAQEDTPSALPEPDLLRITGALNNAAAHPETIRFPFGLDGSNSSGVHVIPPEAMPSAPVWFIGDVHGDYPALLAACDYILSREPESVLCFCGDIIDRGPDSMKTVLRLLDMILCEMPGRVLWIRGNHEDAMTFKDGSFRTNVKPAGMAAFLNEHADLAAFGQDLIRFIRMLPSSVFFPDGLLLTHAGIPMTDLLPKIVSIQDLNLPRVLTDFCWIRIAPDEEYKTISRYSRGNSAGRVNIDEFFLKCGELGIAANRIVAGHNHPSNGFSAFDGILEMENRVRPRCQRLKSALILHNSAIADVGAEDFQPFAIARYRENEQPEITMLHFHESVLSALYPETESEQEEEGSQPETAD